MASTYQCVLQALALLSFLVFPAASEIVYWENQVIRTDYIIPTGDTVILRGTNYVDGQIKVSVGAVLTVDPNQDSLLHVGNIDVYGSFLIGTADAPHTKKAEFELLCQSKKLPTDETRKSIVVRKGGTLVLFGSKGTPSTSDPTKLHTWTKLTDTAEVGDSCLSINLPEGWGVGDEIVIPSTDFDPHQTEIRTITGINSMCIEINEPLEYMHYGLVTEGVDERAEIGLLTRNIVFRGCQEDVDSGVVDVGGHMMFVEGFNQVQVQGIELINFGQGDQLGRYPFHFHLCGKVPINTYLKYNTIRDSNFRAITIHGSQGILLDGNVAYNISGHAFMLEDGAENDNMITRNLIILVKEKTTRVHLGSDAQIALSAFYITNVDNIYTHNAIAAVEGIGFWIHTRLQVKGLSYATGLYNDIHPFKLAIRQIQYNSVHSSEFGFKIESPDLDAFDYPQTSYSPPFTYMPDEMPVIGDFMVHHCRQGGWFRLYRIILDHWIVGDVTEGVQMLTQGNTADKPVETYVRNSLFVGSTANRGTRIETKWQFYNFIEERTDSAMDRSEDSRMGIKLYDGPLYISNCTFTNWYSQPCLNYFNPAIGTRLFNTFAMSSATSIEDTTFIQTDYKIYVNDREADGGKTTAMIDLKGDVSSQIGATVLPLWDFYYAPSCIMSSEWGYACPQRYVNLDVISVDSSQDPTRFGSMMIYRSNVASSSDVPPSLEFDGMYIPAAQGWLYHPIISPGASYVLHFKTHTPTILKLVLSNAKAGDIFVLTVIYPPSTTGISAVFNTVTGLSLNGMVGGYDDTCVNCYYFDSARQLLTLRLREMTDAIGPDNSCPPTGCLGIEIKAQGIVDSTSGVSDIAATQAYPLLLQIESDHGWLQESFLLESTAAAGGADNMNWCNLGDPCLDTMDQGNRRMGILAYYDDPCDGIGCFSPTCRYCKLAFSDSDSPFLSCPYDPNFKYAPPSNSITECSLFVSDGDSASGVKVLEDTSCVTGGLGCINDKCRFCKAWESPQSSAFLDCATLTSTSMPGNDATGGTPSPVGDGQPTNTPPTTSIPPNIAPSTEVPSADIPIVTSPAPQPTDAPVTDAVTPRASNETPNPAVRDAPNPTSQPPVTDGPNTVRNTLSPTSQFTDAPLTDAQNTVTPGVTPKPTSQPTDAPFTDAPTISVPNPTSQPADGPHTDAPSAVIPSDIPNPTSQPTDAPLTGASSTLTPGDTPIPSDTPNPSSQPPDAPLTDAPSTVTPGDTPIPSDISIPTSPTNAPAIDAHSTEPPAAPGVQPNRPIDIVTKTPPSHATNEPGSGNINVNGDATCLSLLSSGDIEVGVGALNDDRCADGGLGCFTTSCRYCQSWKSRESSHLLPCSHAAVQAAYIGDDATFGSFNRSDACWQHASPADIARGRTALTDPNCKYGGLGCLSSTCRFCQARVSDEFSPYMPCDTVEISARHVIDDDLASIPTDDPCRGLVSSGDIAVGITSLTDNLCSNGGVGCVNKVCRYCKVFNTQQSSHLINCLDLLTSNDRTNNVSGRMLVDSTQITVTSPIDQCSFEITQQENQAGLFGYTDYSCDHGGVGCFSKNCRYCRTQGAVNIFKDADKDLSSAFDGLNLCAEYVIASSVNRYGSIESTTPKCARLVSFGDAQEGISAVLDNECTKNPSLGCFAQHPCRYCKYRETSRSASFPECSGEISTPLAVDLNSCDHLSDFLGITNVRIVRDTLCTGDGTHRPVGCVAFTPCRLCKQDGDTRHRELPSCTRDARSDFIASSTSPNADLVNFKRSDLDFTRAHEDEGISLPLIYGLFGCACLFAVAMVVKRYHTRLENYHPMHQPINSQQSIMRLSFDSKSGFKNQMSII